MKKKLIFAFGILLFFGFVAVNCSAQSSTNDQRIVGTWIMTDDGDTVTRVFNANGSCTITNSGGGVETYTYGVSIIGELKMIDRRNFEIKIYFSPDGKTLIIGNEVYRKK